MDEDAIMNKRIGRRKFIGDTSKAVLAASFAVNGFRPSALVGSRLVQAGSGGKAPGASKKKPDAGAVQYRTLGRTGLAVSTIGYGAMRTTNPAVLHRALDLGMNYIDTAHCYQGGNNEKLVGEVMEKRRKDAYIATKVHVGARDAMVRSVEASLKSLRTDYIDVIQLHSLSKPEQLSNEEAMAALEQVKKEGKARFIGFTSHENETALLIAAARLKFYDVALVKYNFRSSQAARDAIREAAKAGTGIVAMKTQAGGYKSEKMGGLKPHQAALKWVLEEEQVATTIPSMVSFDQVEENVQVMGKRLGWNDRKTLDRYARATDKEYCRLCGSCRDGCPYRVSIPDVMRSLMYAEGYGDLHLGRSQYASLDSGRNAARCLDCGSCTARCVNGLDIASRTVRAHQVLA